ncbi:MAG: PH domain-containing protein [Dehalococcoidia bacterium]
MAVAAAGVAFVLALALIARGVAAGVTFAAFGSYAVAVVLLAVAAGAGYLALALFSLRYEVGEGAVIITWGFTRQVAPLAEVERVVRGRALGRPRIHGIELSGWACHVGRAMMPRVGPVLFYSTHQQPEEILYLVTARCAYGISPAEPQAFIQALQQAAEEDNGADLRQELLRHPLAALPLWGDRIALALAAAGTVLGLAVVGLVFSRYDGLPQQTVIPFPDGPHAGSRRALLGIPATVVTLLILNIAGAFALHRVLRPLAYVLLCGNVFIQALLAVAALAAT